MMRCCVLIVDQIHNKNIYSLKEVFKENLFLVL